MEENTDPINQYMGDADEESLDVNALVTGKLRPSGIINLLVIDTILCLRGNEIAVIYKKFAIYINTLEIHLRSMRYVTEENYDKIIEEFKKSDEYIKTENEDIKLYKLSNKKYGIMLNLIYSTTPLVSALKM
jgi:hypothetical protein